MTNADQAEDSGILSPLVGGGFSPRNSSSSTLPAVDARLNFPPSHTASYGRLNGGAAALSEQRPFPFDGISHPGSGAKVAMEADSQCGTSLEESTLNHFRQREAQLLAMNEALDRQQHQAIATAEATVKQVRSKLRAAPNPLTLKANRQPRHQVQTFMEGAVDSGQLSAGDESPLTAQPTDDTSRPWDYLENESEQEPAKSPRRRAGIGKSLPSAAREASDCKIGVAGGPGEGTPKHESPPHRPTDRTSAPRESGERERRPNTTGDESTDNSKPRQKAREGLDDNNRCTWRPGQGEEGAELAGPQVTSGTLHATVRLQTTRISNLETNLRKRMEELRIAEERVSKLEAANKSLEDENGKVKRQSVGLQEKLDFAEEQVKRISRVADGVKDEIKEVKRARQSAELESRQAIQETQKKDARLA
eukprot:GHVT01097540.1.p1 GENE.GHVT01097540.1~~GHVT01097540.1.p1  ORF type:complete len:421 (-),score=85.01 GHVT01097540.1:1147-2409(-)